jgi:hypothetical protein
MEEVDTPLQEKLTVLADNIGYGGMVAAAGTFVAMITMFYLYPDGRETPETTVYDVALKAFIMAVTIVVVAVPEGLPLAVTLSLAFSTQVQYSVFLVYDWLIYWSVRTFTPFLSHFIDLTVLLCATIIHAMMVFLTLPLV